MIVRIVKMKISPEEVETFKGYFLESFDKIRNFPGCSELKLYTDLHEEGMVITYSHWDSQQSLNTYRDSEVFRSTWEKVKPLFIAKPEAFSMSALVG